MARTKCPQSRANAISSLITDMVVRDLWPQAIAEGEGFKTLLKYIEPGYKVHAATHIGQLLSKKHQQGKEALKKKLKEVDISITTDMLC